MDEDPVARWIRDEVDLYTPDSEGGYPLVLTAEELLNPEDQEEPRPAGWPSSPQEMHEHLVRIAPTLQAKHHFMHLHVLHYYNYFSMSFEEHEARREGYLHIEHWQKEGAAEEEGLWVFVALKPRWRVPDREIEEDVWCAVQGLEEPEEDDNLEWDI